MSHDKLAELLSAYLDGEVDAREREYVEREIARDDTARALLEDLRQLRKVTAKLPRQAAPDAMANDVLRLLERQSLLGDADESPYPASRSWRPMRAMLSMAAAMAMLVSGGWWYLQGTNLGQADGGSKLAMAIKEHHDFSAEMDTAKPDNNRRARAKSSSDKPNRMAVHKDTVASKTVMAPPKFSTEDDDRSNLEESAERLVSRAHTEQRLAAGEKLDFLSTHAFENEPVRLRLAIHDASQLAVARESFKLQLARQGLVNAGSMPAATQRTKLDHQSFFYQGKAGTNFQDENQSQMLVRISVGGMQALLDNLSIEGVKDKDVALSAGPIVVRGLAQAQSSVSHFRQPPSEVKNFDMYTGGSSPGNEANKAKKSGEATESQVDIFSEMMKAVGLSKGMLSFDMASPAAKAQPNKPTTSLARNEPLDETERLDFSQDATTSMNGSRIAKAGSQKNRSSPLVERREAALKQSRRLKRSTRSRGALADQAVPAAKAAVTHGEKGEQQYITLVVEFVAPPKNKRTKAKSWPGAKSKSTKPVKAKVKKSEHPLQ